MSYYYKSQPINPSAHARNLPPNNHGSSSAEYSGDANPDDFDADPQPSHPQEKASKTRGSEPTSNPKDDNAIPQTESRGGRSEPHEDDETRWMLLNREEGQRGRSPTVRDKSKPPGSPDNKCFRLLMKSCTN